MTSIAIAKKKEYVKKDQREHVLLRPDMYVGSNKSRKTTEFVCLKNSEGNFFQIIKKEIDVSPAILRIFIEILSNATDNVERSRVAGIPCSYIKVDINKETGEISVVNDGDVIPIEMNNEEKMYNHTLIFGNLLTGSNYDDEEERLISGRNGLGSKCILFGTKVPCFDGSIKNVENIKVGEYLIGDDGNKRKVLNTIRGFGEMYEVSQSRGDSYVVNSEHILSLRMPDHKVIFWSTEKQGWLMVYLDSENQKIHSKSIRALQSQGIECPECGIVLTEGSLNRHYRRIHKDKEIPERTRKGPTINPPNDCEEVRNAYIEMEKFAKTITDDNTIDISIKDYLKSTSTFKSRLTGYKSECVQWERKEVLLDPYILGLWLGDGSQHGYSIAINSEDDYEILNYVKEWGNNNDANFRNIPRCENCKENRHDPNFIPCRHCVSYSISSVENYRKKNKSPLKNLLQKYGLLEEKFIPDEYKINDRDTRLKVLAGLIDSDGSVAKEREGRRICISQGMMHERLADDILYLARSLGFSASKITRDVKWIYKDEIRKGQCVSINISGNGLEDIPTLLPRKKCSSPLSREVLNNGPIKIKKVDDGKFVGLEIDGNERFVINDFTVTHNCTNVFSSKFTVKGLDPNQKKTFEQTWTENMKNASVPIIEKTKLTKGYTSVSYIADFKQFGLKGYTDDIISIYLKYVIDVAMLSKVKVYFNDELIPVNNLQTYSKLYESVSDENLLIKHENSEVLITPSSPSEFQVVSFVNGIYTKLGGQHVDAWSEAIFRPLVDKFNKKGQPTLNIKDIKQFFRIFVVSYVVNPEFESQNKHKLENPKVNVSFKTADLNKILKWSVMEDIEDIIKSKEILTLKKSEKKKKGYVKIDGLDPANKAGTKESHLCSLILCEGLSAKTYAVAGIQKGVNGVSGRDYYGVMSLLGKILNVRNAKMDSIAKNKVITDLIQALNLQHGTDYTDENNFKNLSYGKVIILTDSDVDGKHISSLIMNLFHYLFPSILKRKEPYLVSMETPIVRVFRKEGDLLFYDENKFKEFSKNQTSKIKCKYYKGLGTTKSEDVKDTFGERMVEYIKDDECDTSFNKVFHNKFSDQRKEWLEKYDPTSFSTIESDKFSSMNITDFLNNEMIKFSHDDCKRSIPNLFDGLKQSQRKVIYAMKKRNLTYNKTSLKVAQLAGYVAEVSNYHHGEGNLFQTITKMANEFAGSNNIPLLYRDGQFGSRSNLGADAANARYIFTKMEPLTPLIFREEDDVLLERVYDDGDEVEPKFYIPIIPMVLVNGASGIGSGWSSSIPSYNPIDVINCIEIWLKRDGKIIEREGDTIVSHLPEITPWYRDFKGKIEKTKEKNDTTYITHGVIDKDKNKATITEIPIGMSTDKFKEMCEDWMVDKKIKNFQNYSTPNDIYFVITESEDGFSCNLKNMKLHSYLYTSNMVLFNEKEQLKKYSIEEIINDFCVVRYDFYKKRKSYLISIIKKDLRHLFNKARFVEEVIAKKLHIMNVEEAIIVDNLEKTGYDKENEKVNEDEESGSSGGYNYLLKMQVRTFTSNKVKLLRSEIEEKNNRLKNLESTTEKQLWLNDLDEFKKEYVKWLKIMEPKPVNIKQQQKKKKKE